MAQQTLDKPSLWQMMILPVTQFEKIKQNSVFVQPMITLSIVYLIGNWLAMLGVDVPVPQQTEGVWAEIITVSLTALTYLFALLKPVFITVLLAGIYALCAKVLKYPFSLQQLVSMNAHIWFIAGIGVVVNGAITALIGADMEHVQTVHTSLAGFIHSDGMTHVILEKTDLFSIWVTVLTAIGLSSVAGFSKNVAWIIALGGFLLHGMLSTLLYSLTQVVA